LTFVADGCLISGQWEWLRNKGRTVTSAT